ncbi:MAG: hypothetical protein P8186_11205 [Anaerolineae bacterium]|jgi:hypothetical protein
MATDSSSQVKTQRGEGGHTGPNGLGEFTGFLANPSALKRGGVAIQAARGQLLRGLLERMAGVEVNRFLRAEIRDREGR